MQDESGSVVTGSRFKVAWLRYIYGYSVTDIRSIPSPGLFGNISYRKRWYLKSRVR